MKIGGLFFALTLFLSGCGVIKATEGMPDKMDQMSAQMKKTNDVVDQQPVQISFEDLLKPELGQDLFPVPFDLMPFAQKFGQYAEPEDVVQVVYLWMKKLNELSQDPTNPISDTAFQHHLAQVYSALAAVCGLLPDEKVQTIIDTEIVHEGRYIDSAKDLLLLRVRFIRDVLMNADLFSKPLDDVGKLEQAIKYGNSIDMVAGLPFATDLSLNISKLNIQETMDPRLELKMWTDIKTKSDNYLKAAPAPWKANADIAARMTQALGTVNAKIKSWGGTP